jgi:hypothetical protein
MGPSDSLPVADLDNQLMSLTFYIIRLYYTGRIPVETYHLDYNYDSSYNLYVSYIDHSITRL